MRTIKFLALAIFFVANSAEGSSLKYTGASAFNVSIFEITAADITAYLEALGYTVLTTPVTTDGGRTWECEARKTDGHRYKVTVYTDGENIVGLDEIMID